MSAANSESDTREHRPFITFQIEITATDGSRLGFQFAYIGFEPDPGPITLDDARERARAIAKGHNRLINRGVELADGATPHHVSNVHTKPDLVSLHFGRPGGPDEVLLPDDAFGVAADDGDSLERHEAAPKFANVPDDKTGLVHDRHPHGTSTTPVDVFTAHFSDDDNIISGTWYVAIRVGSGSGPEGQATREDAFDILRNHTRLHNKRFTLDDIDSLELADPNTERALVDALINTQFPDEALLANDCYATAQVDELEHHHADADQS